MIDVRALKFHCNATDISLLNYPVTSDFAFDGASIETN